MNNYNDWTLEELFAYRKHIIEKYERYEIDIIRYWSDDTNWAAKIYNFNLDHLKKINDEIEKS